MEEATNDKENRKVLFELKRDEHDYPPDDWESLWALKMGDGHYRIDNIPFYVRGISCGDIVSVEEEDGELFFKELIEESEHSVFRLIIFNSGETPQIRSELTELSCESEASHIEGFISIDCPPEADFPRVLEYLQKGESEDRWEFEEASLRHEP